MMSRRDQAKCRERARDLLECLKPFDVWLADEGEMVQAVSRLGNPAVFYHRFVKALSDIAGKTVEGETIQ